MLQNAYLLAKIGADTAENERNFAKILTKLATALRAATTPACATAPATCAPTAGEPCVPKQDRTEDG